MSLLTLGLNHKTAPLAIRETVAFAPDECLHALSGLTALPSVREGAIVSTCNRTELYAVDDGMGDAHLQRWLCEQHGLDPETLVPHFYSYQGRDSIRHAMRVASGMDSMILGEPQILGQMKTALHQAREASTAGPILTRLFEHSFAVAKDVRTDTDIGAHPVSVAYAGVSLARRIFADFGNVTVMMIGAGETIDLAARHLGEMGVGKMVFANRSVERARNLASQHRGVAIGLDEVRAHLPAADLVVTSTGAPHQLIEAPAMRDALRTRKRRPVFMLDLAVPRDVDPAIGKMEDVYLYTVDDLQDVIRDNLRSREQAALMADDMLEERIDEFIAWLDSRSAVDTIRAMRGHADQHRDAVLDRAQRLIRQGKSGEEIAAFVANTLTSKLMHAPTSALRNSDGEGQQQLIQSAQRLFDLDDNA